MSNPKPILSLLCDNPHLVFLMLLMQAYVAVTTISPILDGGMFAFLVVPLAVFDFVLLALFGYWVLTGRSFE